MSTNEFECLAKVMLVGCTNVGKTAFVNRFCQGTYSEKTNSTIGIDYQQKLVDLNGKRCLLQLWDTAGQERFRTITPAFYRGAMAIMLCYSVEDRESFNSIPVWVKQIRKYTTEELPLMILGMKCDLVRRQVTEKEGKDVSDSFGADFLEVSAKEDLNVTNAIMRLARRVKLKMETGKAVLLSAVTQADKSRCSRC